MSELSKELRKTFPRKRNFQILEDNEPAGYKSSSGIEAKKESNTSVLCIPKRSPDLNPLDFSVWSAINKAMRTKEESFPKDKKETRKVYLKRLRRTALRLKPAYMKKCIGDMRRRCQRLFDAKGGLLEEGGSSR